MRPIAPGVMLGGMSALADLPGQLPDPPADPGLFGPGSVTWRVVGDPSMALAGLRALLLQTLHPLAMHGVVTNSDFRADPWGRLARTADYVATVTYGTRAEAERAGARVRGIHRRASLDVATEPETGGTYRVSDPDLLLWVHVAEVESFVTTAVRCGLRLTDAEIDCWYDEQRVSARLVGLDAAAVPGSRADVADYLVGVRPLLLATAEARRAARFIVAPPMPAKIALGTPARPAWAALGLTAFGLLPRWARRLYRLPGLPTTDLQAVLAGRALRTAALLLPRSLREGPHRRAALDRLALP